MGRWRILRLCHAIKLSGKGTGKLIKQALRLAIEQSLACAITDGKLGALVLSDIAVVIERPRQVAHGDYACGVCLQLAAKAKLPPAQVGREILDHADSLQGLATAEIVAPGYLNFRLQKPVLLAVLQQIHSQAGEYGCLNTEANQSVQAKCVWSQRRNSLNFELELAKGAHKENRAFFIQYAHARCCCVLRNALEPVLNTQTCLEEPPRVSLEQWQAWLKFYKLSPQSFVEMFDDDAEVFALQKKLVMQLSLFPEEASRALAAALPEKVVRYAYALAADLHEFYGSCRVISDDSDKMRARLGLVLASKQVLANALSVIGVTALERM